MSSIHYKFKATLEYKTLTFDGLHISVTDLKRVICEKENIRTESFDLLLANAHTKRQYSAEELVPRNSSVIIQRIPRENAPKLPKLQDTSSSGIVQKHGIYKPHLGHIQSEDFSKMTEEERLAHIQEVSYQKYQPSNYQRKTTAIMSGLPPPTYVCNRCYQAGHWYKNCPMLTTKRATGILMEELMETTSDDPMAYMHPPGKFVKPIMHHKARLQRKQEREGGSAEGTPVYEESVLQPFPPELTCLICGQLLREAVLAVCCGESFCAECIQQHLLEVGPQNKCPGNNCNSRISADLLVPNKKMRQAVDHYINSQNSTVGASTGVSKEPMVDMLQSFPQSLLNAPQTHQAQRVRIGLSATSSMESEKPVIPQPMGLIQSSEFYILPESNLAKLISFPPPSTSIPNTQTATSPLQSPSSNMFTFAQPLPSLPAINVPIACMTTSVQIHPVQTAISTASTLVTNTSTEKSEINLLTSVAEIPGVGAPPADIILKPPTTTIRSDSISEAWEAFLMRKDQDKKERKRSRSSASSSSSNSASSSNSSFSSSASSEDSIARRRRRKRENDRHYTHDRDDRGHYRPRRSPVRYRGDYPRYRPSPKPTRSERHHRVLPRRSTRDSERDRRHSPRSSPQKKTRIRRRSSERESPKNRRSEVKLDEKRKRKHDEIDRTTHSPGEKESGKAKKKRSTITKEENPSKTIKIKIHSKDKFDAKEDKKEEQSKALNELELDDVKNEKSTTDMHENDNDEEEIERIIQEAQRVKRLSIGQYNESIEDIPAENEQEENMKKLAEKSTDSAKITKLEETEHVVKPTPEEMPVDSSTEEDRDHILNEYDHAWNVTEERSAKPESPTEEEVPNSKKGSIEFSAQLPLEEDKEGFKKEKKKHKKKKRRHSEKDEEEGEKKRKKKHKEGKHKKDKDSKRDKSREEEKLSKKISSYSESHVISDYNGKHEKKHKKRNKSVEHSDSGEERRETEKKESIGLPEKYSLPNDDKNIKISVEKKQELKKKRDKVSNDKESKRPSEKKPSKNKSPEVKNYLRDDSKSPEVKLKGKKYIL